MPFKEQFDDVYSAIKESIRAVSINTGIEIGCLRADEIETPGVISRQIIEHISAADIIIADLTDNNSNVMYELGFAHAGEKPIVLLNQNVSAQPFDLRNLRTIVYEREKLIADLRPRLLLTLSTLVVRVTSPVEESKTESAELTPPPPPRNQVFISYSHADVDVLKRIQVHLKPLERDGRIDLWVDTRIKAGDRWEKKIQAALASAKVAILLISADFLASDFITNNELPPLLLAAEREGVKIVPVIVKPSRFLRDKNLSVFQALNDPAIPVIRMPEAEREELFVRLADIVEYYHP
jgi:hypothetical protein